jgi:uncharacterized protein (TIGR00730 family)
MTRQQPRPGAPRKPVRAPAERIEPLPGSVPKPCTEDPDAPERVRRIVASRAYRRADLDPDLLQRDELRPSRLQLEFLKPELGLSEHGVRSTIVVFGGTRIVEPVAARRQLEVARLALAADPGDPERGRAVAVAERVEAKSHFYDMAREFGRLVSAACRHNSGHECVIVTGGGPGIMEAANRGAYDVSAITVGHNIALPHEQFPNPYITPDLCFQFRYFALRKMHFLLRAKALVAFPGGYGTLDEIFDALCLVQTRKIAPLPIVLVGEQYWRRAFDARFLADEGVIAEEDVELFCYAESAAQAWSHIVEFWRHAGEDVTGGGPPPGRLAEP